MDYYETTVYAAKLLKQAIDELSAERRMNYLMKWQPIETAPKTLKSILVYCAERKNIYTASWVRNAEYPSSGKWHHFPGGPLKEIPTHWMLIPEAPDSEGIQTHR